MNRKFSYIGLAAAAALIGQQALAQSATVDASANVVAGTSSLSIEGSRAGSFGEVAIPLLEGSVCRYVLGVGFDNLRPAPGELLRYVYGSQTNSGPASNPEPGVCEFRGDQTPPTFRINCVEDADISVTLSYAVDPMAQSNYIDFRAFNPVENGMSAVGSVVRTEPCWSGATDYIPAMELTLTNLSAPYDGNVGTITAEVSY